MLVMKLFNTNRMQSFMVAYLCVYSENNSVKIDSSDCTKC